MLKKILKFILIISTFICFINVNNYVFAGDYLYHIMYGHQDYLVIGEVKKVENNLYTIKVTELIESASIRNDIPSIIKVKLDVNWLNKGDNVVISLSKRGGGYQLENGVKKVSTSNTDTLNVVTVSEGSEPDDAALELFLISRGVIKDYYFEENRAYMYQDESEIGESGICIYSPENGKTFPGNYNINKKYIVKENNSKSKIWIIVTVLFILFLVVIFVIKKHKNNMKKKINNNEE